MDSNSIPAPPPPSPVPPPLPGEEQLIAEAAEWYLRLKAGKLPGAEYGGWLTMDRGRLRVTPRDLMRSEYEFIFTHREQLKSIASLPTDYSRPPRMSRREEYRAKMAAKRAVIAQREAAKVAERAAKLEERAPSIEDRVAKVASPIDTTDSPRQRPVVAKEPEPEFYVEGYRITEHDVRSMLSWFSDEELAAYDEGRVSKDIAYANCADALRDSVRIGGHVVWRGHSGEVHMFPDRELLSEIVDWQRRMGFLRSR